MAGSLEWRTSQSAKNYRQQKGLVSEEKTESKETVVDFVALTLVFGPLFFKMNGHECFFFFFSPCTPFPRNL